nr:xanthine dehydrogenase [Tanacetum cinerariifolium]
SGADLNGKAAQNAAEILKQRLVEFAAKHYQCDESRVEFRNGHVRVGDQVISFDTLAQQAWMGQVSLSSTGYYKTPKIFYDRSQARGRPFYYFAFGAACTEVLVDTLTGEYKMLRTDILHDVGASLNPAIDIGQVEGGYIQGMGWLTTEELVWNDKGKLMTNGPAGYKIPAVADMPADLRVKLVENRKNPEDTVFHSKAVGEPPFMLGIAAWCAIKDAVASLGDYRHQPRIDAPATPERVLWGCADRGRHRRSRQSTGRQLLHRHDPQPSTGPGVGRSDPQARLADPAEVGVEASYEYFADGLMLVKDGRIVALGNAEDLLATLADDVEVVTYDDALITAGFIDTHVHLPQTGMIGSYGEQLLDWLNTYVFPCEKQFEDPEHSAQVADIFLNELLRNGTTTALVFGSRHKESVEALFSAAEKLNLRLIAGKGRLHYAVTPRFAPTSTPEQMTLAGQLLTEYPDLYLQTHISENLKEIEWVKALFPEHKNYLDVYDHFNLLGQRSVFAHGVHLCDEECERLAETGSAIAFCPTSNLFLGSGLFDLPMAERHKVNVGLGTDVGAGTSFSLLHTLNEAYKVMQLQGARLSPFKSLYLATLGGARALRLEDKIGNLQAGSEADFVVLDFNATPLLSYRMKQATSIEEQLFVLMTLGDDRTVSETYSAGVLVHKR